MSTRDPLLFIRNLEWDLTLWVTWERSGSVVECLTWDRGAAGSSLTGDTALCPWARHINPSLVLVQPRKTRPYITERLLIGRKESNQIKHFELEWASSSTLILLVLSCHRSTIAFCYWRLFLSWWYGMNKVLTKPTERNDKSYGEIFWTCDAELDIFMCWFN